MIVWASSVHWLPNDDRLQPWQASSWRETWFSALSTGPSCTGPCYLKSWTHSWSIHALWGVTQSKCALPTGSTLYTTSVKPVGFQGFQLLFFAFRLYLNLAEPAGCRVGSTPQSAATARRDWISCFSRLRQMLHVSPTGRGMNLAFSLCSPFQARKTNKNINETRLG